ncbi:MAG: hypothetical protein WC734_04400 [Patescibacteria group bacterium]|jgi:uncharacterized membrane protein
MDKPTNESKSNGVSQDDKTTGAISYIWIVSLIMLVTKKDSEFVKFHAQQGFVLFVASVILGFIPFIGWIVWPVCIIGMIYGFYNAMNGLKREIPVIGQFGKKINF